MTMMQKITLEFIGLRCILCIMIDDAPYICELSEIAEVAAGYPIRGSVESLPEGEVGVIQLRNVDADQAIRWGEIYKADILRKRTQKRLDERSVLFSGRGLNIYALSIGQTPFPAVASPHFFVIYCTSDLLIPSFLAWQLNQAPAQNYFRSVSAGSAQKSVRRRDLEMLEVSVPSLSKQEAILNLWRTAQKEREALRAIEACRMHQLEAVANDLLSSRQERAK